MKMIRLSKSIVGKEEADAAQRVILEDGYLGMGKEVQAFENEIKAFLGYSGEIACVNTGTAALHLACQAIGLSPGDEVIVPSLTFVACFHAIAACGARPVACDVHLESGLLDLERAKHLITPRTKALMYVHYYGNPGDLDALYQFAKTHRLRLIEDAAHSFGTEYRGRKIGTMGDVVCFSFDGIKNITSGEGGAVIAREPAEIEMVKDLRLLGIEKDSEKRFLGKRSWEFDVKHQGWRYHMSNLMAAIGREQLKKFEVRFKPMRIEMAERYRQGLSSLREVVLLSKESSERTVVVPHIFPIRVLSRRDELREALSNAGIEVGIHYKPSHLLTKFRDSAVEPLPNTERLYRELLTLPLHPDVTSQDQDRIVGFVKDFFR